MRPHGRIDCRKRRLKSWLLFWAVALPPSSARALDKQGSAHGGSIEGPTSGMTFGGSATFGVSLFNPSYAARPDNTGLALFRYAVHFDLDLIGRRLSVPFDVNTFTDKRARPRARAVVPSELDLITGVTSTWRLGPGAIEAGTRVEHDRSADRGGYAPPPGRSSSQTYVDARVRYLYSIATTVPGIARALQGGDVSGWLTLGWFAFNRSYFARPDNTGLALFRYAIHTEVSFWQQRLAVGLDAIFFSDRQAANVLRPTELDLTPELIGRYGRFEAHLAYERDMPLDRDGLVQHFLYLVTSVGF